ncbi:ABC transporter ATP-binding protein [Haloplanus litoreus]|uniref:Probable branched-chain amino acid transport ATP-binding protein LivG n=1 Tax=Haloplanus litoreus TaxID=767515 RepID=A0ABD5ZXG4_9EURY
MQTEVSETATVDDAVLAADSVRKTFGEIVAVDDCSFEIERGSITGLIGPNGAGKSTMFDCISGFYQPDAGTIRFDGTDITGLPAHKIAHEGLVRTFQITRDLAEMTVMENMMLTPKNQTGESMFHAVFNRDTIERENAEIQRDAEKLLELFQLDHVRQEYAGNLSGGQRKLLEMARMLMLEPEAMLLDEPMAGVNPTLENDIVERIEELNRQEGVTFVIVEHDMDLVMDLCDRIIVMNEGRDLAAGTPAEIQNDERVLEAYLGGDS